MTLTREQNEAHLLVIHRTHVGKNPTFKLEDVLLN